MNRSGWNTRGGTAREHLERQAEYERNLTWDIEEASRRMIELLGHEDFLGWQQNFIALDDDRFTILRKMREYLKGAQQ